MLYPEHKVIGLAKLDGKRHIHSSCIEHSELTDDPHVAPFAQIRDLLSFLHSESHESGGNALCLLQGFFISGWLPCICVKILFPKERILRIFTDIFLDKVNDCQSFCHDD